MTGNVALMHHCKALITYPRDKGYRKNRVVTLCSRLRSPFCLQYSTYCSYDGIAFLTISQPLSLSRCQPGQPKQARLIRFQSLEDVPFLVANGNVLFIEVVVDSTTVAGVCISVVITEDETIFHYSTRPDRVLSLSFQRQSFHVRIQHR